MLVGPIVDHNRNYEESRSENLWQRNGIDIEDGEATAGTILTVRN